LENKERGRRREFSDRVGGDIAASVCVSTKVLGDHVEKWTLSLLCEKARKLTFTKNTSDESVSRIPKEKRLVYRRSKTLKEVKHKETYEKWRNRKRLYRRCAEGSAVLFFDEMEPI